MRVPDEIRWRQHDELAECFAVIDTCLGSYYDGARHMYRPLVGQLRILLCDKPPLLSRVFPNLQLGALRPIEWLAPPGAALFENTETRLAVEHPPDQEFRLAQMPFLITEYENGLQVADLRLEESNRLLPLDQWMDQLVTVYPSKLSLREIIRSIADKGGGARVDDKVNNALRDMRVTGPSGVGVHVLFSVAVGRCVQEIGVHYAQFRERFGYRGRLQNVTVDPDHPSAKNKAKVPRHLECGRKSQFVMTVMMRTR
jgi:hypothetical protein